MVVEVKVTTGGGSWQGAATSITGYTIKEDATPLDPSDTSGSTGSISFGVAEDASASGTIKMLNSTINLADTENGEISGVARTLDTVNGVAGIELETSLSLLNVDAVVNGYRGTLTGAFAYYFSLVGLGSPAYTVDTTIATRQVVFQGWAGKLWDGLKEICAAQGIEIAYVSNKIVVRPPRGREAVHYRDSSVRFNITSAGDAARAIEIYAYHNEYKTFAVLYPAVRGDESIISVEAGEVKIVRAEVNASIIALVQPSPQLTIDPVYTNASGYVVIDKDKNVITPALWEATGGKVTVGMGESPQEILITITGGSGSLISRGPFQLALKQGSGDDEDIVASLVIGGEAIVFSPEKLTIPTGADPAIVKQEIGITVDNPQIGTLAEAYSAGLRTAMRYSGISRGLDISAARINRVGESGSERFYTFDEFQAEYNPTTFTQWEGLIQWNGKTFNNFEEFYSAVHDNDFSNQAFGNVEGARVLYRNSYYRVRTATINTLGLQYTAEPDTLVSDFELKFAGEDGTGMTFTQYETMMAGKTFDDQGSSPLWLELAIETGEGYGSGEYGSDSYGY